MRVSIAIVVLLGRAASAQPAANKASAEALFVQGRDLAREHRHAEACPKFEASQKLDPALGTELNLADCYEQLGRFASAWGMFRQAADEARRLADDHAERIARERAAALEPRLSRLTIQPPKQRIAGTTMTRNGELVDPATWGTAIPVDAGAHTLHCAAAGRRAWTQELAIQVGESRVTAVPELVLDPVLDPATARGNGESVLQVVVDEPDETYEVEMVSARGIVRCAGSVARARPCTLAAPPGLASIRVRGSSTLSEEVSVSGKPVLLTIEKTSRYLRYAGAAAAGAGGIALAVGLYACSARSERDIRDGTATGLTCVVGASFGGVGLLAGGAMVVMDMLGDHHTITTHADPVDEQPARRYPVPRRRTRTYASPVPGGLMVGFGGSL
jgi:hypothetical protein